MLGQFIFASTLLVVAAAQDASVSSAIASDLSKFFNSYINDPSVVSLYDAISSGYPDVAASMDEIGLSALENANAATVSGGRLSYIATAPITFSTTPPYLSDLPSSLASAVLSVDTAVAKAQQDIVATHLGLTPPGGFGAEMTALGAAPAVTPAPAVKIVGGVLVGVGVAAAML